jgi:RNA polymerase sigma-70 factor (ECF subfamily)
MNEVTKTTYKNSDFEAVYKEFKPAIVMHLRTKVQNEEEREEIMMTVMCKLAKHLESYDVAKGKLNTWIFTIVNNLVIDYYRSDRYNKHEALTTNISAMVNEEGEEAFQISADSTASTNMENNELADKILTAFDQIKPTYKEIAIQFFIHEQKYNEIAEAMSIPLNTVKVAILRAREVLQSNLKAEYASM